MDSDPVAIPVKIEIPKEVERKVVKRAIETENLDELDGIIWDYIELDIDWVFSEPIEEEDFLRA